MNKNRLMFVLIGISIILAVPLIHAAPIEWHNMPKTGNDAEEIFQFRFEIKADETTNYTITINPNEDFEPVDGTYNITKEIPVDATRTFIFDMKILNDLEDGKHPVPYVAYKNGTQFKTGNIYVRAGTQTPGFELFFVLCSLIIVGYILKKKTKQ